MANTQFHIEKGIFFLSPEPHAEDPRKTALQQLRKKENRVYDIKEVQQLPQTFFYNLQKEEWKRKAVVLKRFVRYFARRIPNLTTESVHLLDLGCGTGWFSAHIAREFPGVQVFGLDNYLPELEQAASAFYEPNLKFLFGDFMRNIFAAKSLDFIVLNNALAAFPDFDRLIELCLFHLSTEGEIHLIDNALFPIAKLESEKQKIEHRLAELHCQSAAPYIHVHSIETLEAYSHDYIFNPSSLNQRFRRSIRTAQEHYPWIRIVKDHS